MEHILSLSYGKDSLACLGAIEQLGWPLERIVHAEVWATDTIPADLPPMVEFKAKADEIIKERWGIAVEHCNAGETYEHHFYRVRGEKSPINGGIMYGWPMRGGTWCNSDLKMRALRKARSEQKNMTYIGIAADEPNRFHNLSSTKISPLVEAGWTEDDCRKWCEENDLLSPIYTTTARGGCWFCHNQRVNQLRLLRRTYPDLWELMLKWDTDSSVAEGHIMQGNKKLNEVRIHPTQKPVALYEWIFSRYAKLGDKILDTHLGSGSSRIAAYDAGLDFVGCEINPDYFKAQENRFQEHIAQRNLFLEMERLEGME